MEEKKSRELIIYFCSLYPNFKKRVNQSEPQQRPDVSFWVGIDFFHYPVVFVASCLSLSY